jgi:predicted helicase
MSHIQTYRRDLDDQRRIAGADNEGAVSQAFAGLLKAEAAEHKLIFTQQYACKARDGVSTVKPDGALVDRLRLLHGLWEAKDSKDDIDKEIAAKLAKGYPTENIIFEDSRTAVLYQNGDEILRVALADGAALQSLLDRFFGFLPRAVEDFRVAKSKFLHELPQVALALEAMLAQAYADNPAFKTKAADFLALCKRAVGERVTARHVDEMLIQHVLTDQIFQAVFPAAAFHRANHLAQAVSALELTFLRGEARANLLSRLEPYFAAIRRTAANAVTHEDKQDFLKEVYEDFYTAYNPKDADKLGVVYTPHEAVRFIIKGCDWLAQKHFGRRLADPGLDILDPCTGTGTFIVDLIDFLRGDRQALIRKFDGEIHANAISILPLHCQPNYSK